jgi:hypothetical protein
MEKPILINPLQQSFANSNFEQRLWFYQMLSIEKQKLGTSMSWHAYHPLHVCCLVCVYLLLCSSIM